ncbi:MAG: insulinase family protein [Bacilli bacterium]|nr:insulinase family protein [Bacilli bacterium]
MEKQEKNTNKNKYKYKDIDVCIEKTNKFTTTVFNIYYINKYDDNNYLSLVSELLTKCNGKYTSTEAQTRKLYDLYSAGVYSAQSMNYKTQILKCSVECISENIIDCDDLYDECFDLLNNMIYNPHVRVNSRGRTEFCKKDFDEVIENRINLILNESNNKRRYGAMRFLSKMTKKDEFPLIQKMNINKIKKIKAYELYDYYLDFINNSHIIVSVVGNVSVDKVNKLLNKLNLRTNNVNIEYEDKNLYRIIKTKRYVEKLEIKQSHIYMGYRTDLFYRHELYAAYILFCLMFGESPFSSLFRKVREKLGLAYTIYASANPVRNLCTVYAGVDSNNINKAIKAIKDCLNSYNIHNINKNREYFENLLNEAKSEFKNEYINSIDNQEYIVSNNLKYYLTDRRTLEELYNDSLLVTLDDISKIKDHLWLDTIYVLKGLGENNE